MTQDLAKRARRGVLRHIDYEVGLFDDEAVQNVFQIMFRRGAMMMFQSHGRVQDTEVIFSQYLCLVEFAENGD